MLGCSLTLGGGRRASSVSSFPEALYKALLGSDLVATSPSGTPGTGTITRNSTAQYPDSTTGIITTASANTARFVANDATGRNALLLEPESTNRVTGNKSLTTGWTNFFDGSGPLTSGDAPNGVANEATNSYNQFGFGSCTHDPITTNFVADDVVTVSVYAKNLSATAAPFMRLGYRHRDGSWTRIYFDLENGEVGDLHPGDDPVLDSYMRPAANGYYRCAFTISEIGGASNDNQVAVIQTEDEVATPAGRTDGDGQSYWGIQVEESAYPSSVIYTTTVEATREAERAEMPSPDAFIDNTVGAYSFILRQLSNSQLLQSPTDPAHMIIAGDNNVTFMMLAQDGGTKPNGSYQFNPGEANTSYVSGIFGGYRSSDERICMTYDASGSSTFPGTKRFMFRDTVKQERVNNTGNDDAFTNFPATTVMYLGYKDAFTPTVPMLLSDLNFWPELTDEQASLLSSGGTTYVEPPAIPSEDDGVLTASIGLTGAYFMSDGSHTATQASTDGSGTGAEFTVTISGNAITSIDSVDTAGTGYVVGETITVAIAGVTEFIAGEIDVDTVG